MAFRNGLAAAAAMAIAVGAGFELRSASRSPFRTRASRARLAPMSARAPPNRAGRRPTSSRSPPISSAPSGRSSCRPRTCRCLRLSIPHNVYAGAGAGMFSPAVAGEPSRVYSPNLITGKVDVIDPETFKVVDSLAVMPSPEHIVPSWDLRPLWVSADVSARGGHGGVAPLDPKTGKLGKPIDVPDSYNIYFTPDGKSAIIVAEAMRRLEFRDPHTMALQGYINTPACAGINHADFSPDGSLCDLHLRIQRFPRQDRSRPSHARRDPAADARPHAAGHQGRPGRQVLLHRRPHRRRRHGDRRRFVRAGRFHQDRNRRAWALSEPRRHEALCLQSRNPQSRRREARARAASR